MKKNIFFIILIMFFNIVAVYSFEMVDSNLDIEKKIAVLEILPISAALNCDVFINGGAPEKYTVEKQIFYYYPSFDNKLKIDINLPFESNYKSKTYSFDVDKTAKITNIKIQLNRKLSPEAKRISKLIVNSVNSFIAYKQNGNIDEFRAPTADIGALYHFDKFMEEMSELDVEEMGELLALIKNNLQLQDDKFETLVKKIIDNVNLLHKVSAEITELKNNKSISATGKKTRQDQLSNKFMEILWNCVDINRIMK